MRRILARLAPRPDTVGNVASGFATVDAFEWRPKTGGRNFGDHLATVVTAKMLADRNRSLGEQSAHARRLFSVGSVIHFATDGDCVWGSGRNGKIADAAHRFSHLDVRAVRGPLTAEYLRGRGIAVPDIFGDPALLIPHLFPGRFVPAPAIDCLFVPNLHDLAHCPKDVPFISPLLGWNRVVEAIMRARLVVASSLHGLVLAEAFGIPARYLRLSESENLFKYRDYAAGTGRPTLEVATSIDQARDMGGMDPIIFDPARLIDAFPLDLWDWNPAAPAARQIGHGAIWSLINSSLGQILVLLVFFVTARFVSAADFGILAICLLVVELVKQVLIESFAAAITASAEPDDRDYNACFLLILACSVGGAAVALGIGTFAAPLFDNPQLAPVLQLVSLLLVTSGLSRTHEAWMARHMQFRALAIRSIVSIVIGGAVGIWLAVSGWGVFALVAQQLVIAVIATASLWKLCAWRPGLSTKPGAFRALWRFGRHTAAAGFTNFVNTQADTAFASWYLGATATGIYTSAKRILLGLNLSLVTALNRVALPAFANLRGDPERMRSSFLTAASFTSAITAPIFAGLTVVSGDVVLIAMGPSWTAVGPILSLIAVTAYLTTIGQYNQAVILVHDKPQWQVAMAAVHAISNIALFAVVIRYGLVALALAFSVRAILLYPMSIGVALMLLRLKVGPYVRRVGPSVLSALVMAGAVFAFRAEVPIDGVMPRLCASVAVGGAAYFLAMAVVGRAALRDLLRFARVLIRAE